jgi:hypothetical protein
VKKERAPSGPYLMDEWGTVVLKIPSRARGPPIYREIVGHKHHDAPDNKEFREEF